METEQNMDPETIRRPPERDGESGSMIGDPNVASTDS